METVTAERRVDAAPSAVREAMGDREAFMLAAGFDDVTVEDDRITIRNAVGPFSIELVVDVVEAEAALAYEQVEGIFESMRTEYTLEPTEGGTTVRAETTFAVADLPVLGQLLDATVVKRQRRTELTDQFDWLEAQVA